MSRTLIERFWANVEKRGPDDCWLWKAGGVKGYGRITIGSGNAFQMLAHRLSYVIENGPILRGLCVLHDCDNPACVNPAHLWLGTRGDNNRDMARKGRAKGGCLTGEQIGNSKLTDCDVRNIRAEFAKGGISQSSLGKFFGVSDATISRVVTRQTYAGK